MELAHRRHDISDRVWERIRDHLPGGPGKIGRPSSDNRRFCLWHDRGVWENLLKEVTNTPDLEWLIVDSTYIKVHPHGTGARGGNQKMGRTKGSSTVNCT